MRLYGDVRFYAYRNAYSRSGLVAYIAACGPSDQPHSLVSAAVRCWAFYLCYGDLAGWPGGAVVFDDPVLAAE